MSSYTSVFGNDTVPPSGRSYRLIPLTGHTTVEWPFNYDGADFIADINDVTGSAANWHLGLPPADQASKGQDLLLRNVGLYPFQVNNANATPIATLLPGEVKYFYISDNSTDAGVWNVFTFGTGSSAADAASLKGSGLTVIGSRLAAAHPVYSLADNVTATVDDRAKVFAYTGGSNTLTLPTSSTLGDNWFVGVRNAGSGSITIQTTGLDRIDHQTTATLSPGESLFIFCTGATFYTIGYGRSTQFQFTKLVKDVSAGGAFTLTSGEAANKLLQFTGAPVANVTINVPAIVSVYYVHNLYTGSATLTVKTAAGSGETLASNERAILFCDGVNVIAAMPTTGGGGGGGGGGFSGVFADGTVSAPSITFNSDNNLGFWRQAADVMGLACNGAEVMRWSTATTSLQSGNFGIGTLTPSAKLDVRGVGVISGGGALSGSLPTGTVLQIGAADGQDSRLLIDSYGSSSGPHVSFRQSRGTASVPTATQLNNDLGVVAFRGRGATAWSTDRGYVIGRATQNWTDTAQGIAIVFGVTPNNSVTPAIKMILDSNGWLCVNNNVNPQAPLDVNGNARVLGAIECAGVASSKGDIPLSLNNSAYGGLVNMQSLGITRGYISVDESYAFKVMNGTGTDDRFRVFGGTSGVEAYAYLTISDERKKELWKEVPNNFLEKLSKVKHGFYTLKEDNEVNWYLGVSAQSIQREFPEAVSEDPDGILSVSYGNAALVGVIALAKEVMRLRDIVEGLIED